MFREDRELLADLKRTCNDAGLFALEYVGGDLSVEAEEAYALRLIDIGERLLLYAKGRKVLVIDATLRRGEVRAAPAAIWKPGGRRGW